MSNETPQDEYPSPKYAWYVVGVLTVAYMFSFIDRQIISMLVKPIRADLGISEVQISLLMGASFAIFYTLFGIPLGRLADLYSRRTIIAFGITFWSLMTAGCGLTRGFWDLALMRMGVGVGEAALSPAAYSLLADYFPPQRRSTAMSVYSMGIYIGSGMAFILGGFVSQFASSKESFILPIVGAVRSWQMVFFIVGLPGLLVALFLTTVKEPKRKSLSASNPETPAKATIGQTMAYVLDNKLTFLCLNFGVAMVTLNSYASSNWIPSMLARRFEWPPGQVGLVYGLIAAICGTAGVVFGGWLADKWARQGCLDAPVRVAWLGSLCGLPCTLLYAVANTGFAVALLLVPLVFFGSMPFGVAPAAIQRMMPSTMRAQATSIYLFIINLLGMALGPYLAAELTQSVFRDENAVHHSLMVVGVVSYLIAIVLLGLSLKNYRRTLDYLQSWNESKAVSV